MGNDYKVMKPIKQWSSADIIAFARSVDKKTWGIILAGVLGVLIFIIFIIIPAWIERPLLRHEIQKMQTQINQVNALNEKRKAWEEDQKVFGALIEKTQARVLTAQDMGSLLGIVSKMADESRVDLLSSKPQDEKTIFPAPYHLKYQPSGYEFSFQGGYHDLGNFMSRIESSEKLLTVRSFSIESAEKTPDRQIAGLRLWAILKAPPVIAPAVGVGHAKKK